MAYVSSMSIDSVISEITGSLNAMITQEECLRLGNELASMLSAAGGSYFAAQPSIASAFGSISVELTTNGCNLYLGGNLSRPSLNPGNAGAYNIVSLFVHGWNGAGNPAMRKLHGMWHGEMVGARLQRESTSFISDTIDQFNSMHGDIAYATVGGEYA